MFEKKFNKYSPKLFPEFRIEKYIDNMTDEPIYAIKNCEINSVFIFLFMQKDKINDITKFIIKDIIFAVFLLLNVVSVNNVPKKKIIKVLKIKEILFETLVLNA